MSALVAALGWAWLQSGTIDRLERENAALVARVASCNARIDNIREDRESDATVDDLDGFTVPPGWMLNPAGP